MRGTGILATRSAHICPRSRMGQQTKTVHIWIIPRETRSPNVTLGYQVQDTTISLFHAMKLLRVDSSDGLSGWNSSLEAHVTWDSLL